MAAYVTFSREECELIVMRLRRAAGFCQNAIAASRKPSKKELMMEPTSFYSGASGYAGATMRSVIDTLEAHLNEE